MGVSYILSRIFFRIFFGEGLELLPQLIAEGGESLGNILYVLILNNDVETTEALLTYGVELKFVDVMDNDSITLAVKHNKPEMFYFLLDNNLAFYNPYSYDTLGYAIDNYLTKTSDDIYIKELLARNHHVELSHYDKVESAMRKHDLQTYTYLIENYPVLAR